MVKTSGPDGECSLRGNEGVTREDRLDPSISISFSASNQSTQTSKVSVPSGPADAVSWADPGSSARPSGEVSQ